MVRSQLNRLLLVAVLLVALPGIAIAERLRRGAGRRLAVTAIGQLARACGIRIETAGGETLEVATGAVLVPNHTSPMDIAAVLVARPDARFVAAAELFRIPLLGTAMRALGTVPIERHDSASSHQRVAELSRPQAGRSLVMFPEGRIAPTAEVGPFKTGAFVVAIQSGVAVIPVAITGSSEVLPRKGRLRLRPGTVRVQLLDPLPTAGLDVDDRADLARRARDRVVDGIRRAA